MKLNSAQLINRTLTGCPNHPEADAVLAAQQTHAQVLQHYRAPHANRGTPARLHYSRKTQKAAEYRPGSLFKGYRI